MNIVNFLAGVATLNADRPALSVGGTCILTYGELGARVPRIAGSLLGVYGLRPGDRVGFLLNNCPEYIELKLACWHAGLCVVPINAKLHAREIAFILAHCGARACFTTSDHSADVEAARASAPDLTYIFAIDDPQHVALLDSPPAPLHDARDADPAWIFYTSGTTGFPKGATLSHANLWGMSVRYFMDIDWVSHEDTYLHAAPISHGSGLYGVPHLMRASNIVVPASRGFDPAEIFGLMDRYNNLTFFAAPTMINRLTAHAGQAEPRIEAIKTIYYGGAPMYLEDMKRALAVFGPRFHQIFGQGESPMTGIGLSKALHVDDGHPRFEARLASTGVARPGVDVRIVDEDDNDVPVGVPGEVLFRSDVVMLGYWNDPNATERALRGGWLHTGDVGVFDEDGFVTLKDRSKDMIISGGTNIYPREVEEVLLTDARVSEVAVVGRHHADWGEEVVAFVVAQDGAAVDPADLDALCLANIARFKRPKHYEFVAELPKSAYGKILKRELRALLAAPPGA